GGAGVPGIAAQLPRECTARCPESVPRCRRNPPRSPRNGCPDQTGICSIMNEAWRRPREPRRRRDVPNLANSPVASQVVLGTFCDRATAKDCLVTSKAASLTAAHPCHHLRGCSLRRLPEARGDPAPGYTR